MDKERITLWKENIRDRQASGLTVDQWCEQHQVPRHTYYYWKRKIKQAEASVVTEQEVLFAEVMQEPSSSHCPAQLEIRWNGMHLITTDREGVRLAAEFVRQLQKQC